MSDNFHAADKRFEPVDRSKAFKRILDLLGLRRKRMLDLGCGYGEYLVKFGEGSLGVTTNPEEVEYGARRNLQIRLGNVEFIDTLGLNEQFEGVWANNVFEHLLSPHAFLMKLKSISGDETLLVVGVPVIPRIASLVMLRWFRGVLAGAHVNFFTRESLRLTIERAGWKVKEVRPFRFRSRFLDTIASFFSPHLYAVAYNDQGFAYPEKKVKEWIGDPYYHDLLRTGNRL